MADGEKKPLNKFGSSLLLKFAVRVASFLDIQSR
jgi:hypothetical protein